MHYRLSIAFINVLCIGSIAAQFQEQSLLFKGTYSKNYVNRWAFQKICDHVYDPHTNPYAWPTDPEGVSFDPNCVKEGDIIFVRCVHRFMKELHRQIMHPYIMVTAGEARDQVTSKHLKYLDDDKIIAWFAVHLDCYTEHPKLYPIPLGLYQDKRYYHPRKKLAQEFAQLRQVPKEKLLYSNFGDLKGLKPERAEIDELFEDADFCYTIKKRMPFLKYMKQMSEFRFSLSPRGYGPDTYRTWEALLVGSIPIVCTSQLDRLYADLPILIIDDWKQVTKEFLEKKYTEMTKKKWSIEKLCIEYWKRKILSVQADHFKKMKNVS